MNLREALGIRQHEVVSIVGGGGKTTILYRLAAETASVGGKAIVTGTTRFTPPAAGRLPPAVLLEDRADRLVAVGTELERSSIVVVGAGWGNQGRIMPVEGDELADFAQIKGVVLVVAEADGSAGRPFKAPAEHEPVVAPSTTLLLSVVGLDVLGATLGPERVHRPDQVAELTRTLLGTPITVEMVARVLLSERGGRKGLPAGGRWIPVLNKADSAERREAAKRLGGLLLDGGAERVVIATAAGEPPVAEVLR
jgi:probable selenium-dependent hydroxylase accessory protein YqeC